VVMLENHGYADVIGNANMPYFNQLWNEGLAGTGPVTDYQQMYAVAHPSLPNYLAIASGSTQGRDGSDSVSPGQFNAPSVADQLTAAGISWAVYQEGMPVSCAPNGTYNDTAAGGTDGQYVLRHNPGTPFTPIYTSAECQNVQPLSALNIAALPQVSFVAPNICNDDHGLTSAQLAGLPYRNCLTGSTALVQRGDAWLQQHVNAWTSAGADVLITWDEGVGNAGVNGTTTTGGGQIASLLTGPGIPPAQDSTQYSHYSVLAGIENRYGLPLLANAATANPVPLPGSASSASSPAVSITQPASGTTVSGTTPVSGTAQAQGSAGIAQVNVSLDNGTSQLATGTTSWTATIDTTGLTNGTHTITVRATDTNGSVGTAGLAVAVNNVSTTACPAVPAGVTELSGNVSLESSQSGWTGIYNASSVVTRAEPASGSYDSLWALQVALKSGTSGVAGVNNASPMWVPGPPGVATAAGQVYTGSAFVRAGTAGEKLTLLVRETTSGGTGVGFHSTTVTLSDTNWHQISSVYTAKATSNTIRYSLYASNLANSGQYFLADCMSLQTP
jgi:phosphatidylinositol-3-phosphatase